MSFLDLPDSLPLIVLILFIGLVVLNGIIEIVVDNKLEDYGIIECHNDLNKSMAPRYCNRVLQEKVK